MSSNFFEDHNDQDKVEEELDEEEEEVSEMQILHSREVEDTDRLDLNEFLNIAKEESKKDKEESININSPFIVLSKQQQTFPTTIEKKEEEQIVSPFIDLSIFPKNIVDFTQLFQQERSEENKIDDESELLLDSLFYPHPIRLLVLQQKKKKKSTPSINAISSPIQSYPSSLNNLNNNNTIEELLDATFTLNHLLYICLILQRRQLYQMKQIQKLLQNNLNELNNYLFEINDFGMTAESICYCLESNRYLNESFEGKEIKKLNNNLTLGSLYVSKKKLINFIELYPELFEIIKFRKQVEVISLKFKCYQLLQNNDFKQVIYFTKKENTLLIKEEEKEILNIEFKNLKEKTTLNIFNEEHLKTMFKILKTEFPLQRSSYKLSLLRKLLFNKYDFKHFNLISFLQAFPQHFIVNTKSTKQKVRIITKEQDLNNFKPKIENVLFSEKVIKSVNKNNNELQQLNEEDNNKQKKKELPILELPKDFKIISTFKEEEVDQWINENIYQPLQNNNENVVIGMDTEFDLFKLNKNYQLNPVLHEKLWILFKKQKEESINNKSYYKEEDIQLLKNYLREYDQNIYPDLIQISTVNSCLLYNTCEGRVKPSNLFRKIMMDKNVIKCWCSYSEDVRVISAWFKYYDNLDNNNGITTNVLNKEEEEVYKKEQEDGGFKGLIELDSSQLGVANLIESSLGMKMGKERQVQVSRWSRKYLSEIQRKYAAQDAYINCLLYQKYNDEEKDYTNAEDEELISFSLFNPLND
ncbi:hypothetical protein ABK040_013381 [Willaertia magna]